MGSSVSNKLLAEMLRENCALNSRSACDEPHHFSLTIYTAAVVKALGSGERQDSGPSGRFDCHDRLRGLG